METINIQRQEKTFDGYRLVNSNFDLTEAGTQLDEESNLFINNIYSFSLKCKKNLFKMTVKPMRQVAVLT